MVVPVSGAAELIAEFVNGQFRDRSDQFGGGGLRVIARRQPCGEVCDVMVSGLVQPPRDRFGDLSQVRARITVAWAYDGRTWRATALEVTYHARPDTVAAEIQRSILGLGLIPYP